MPTPVEYAERYRNVPVVVDGQRRSVRVETYRKGKPDTEQGSLWHDLKQHFAQKKKTDASYRLRVRVESTDIDFSSPDDMMRRVVNPFWGKGSPEDCQVTLEVAVMLGRTSIDAVQRYADSHIGLDCNGFVGNYIWHIHQQNAWNTWPGDAEPGPSMNIESLLSWVKRNGREITTISEMSSSKMYMLAEVDDSTLRVIPGGGGRDGHCVITEPQRFMQHSFVVDSFAGLDLRAAERGAYDNPAYWAVESTGRLGLRESWYAFQAVQRRSVDVPGVFQVFRGSKGTSMRVRVAELA
jgi:hypothetical protein